MNRSLVQVIHGTPVSDGGGVRLNRLIGGAERNLLDPFLLFDVFDSATAADYIAGFPPHPHRGVATLTWMLEGRMRHRDNAGNEGLITTGGLQWMNAGRGIVHSEMPEQQAGRMRGVQLWINLPAAHKGSEPFYQDVAAPEIPADCRAGGERVRPLVGRAASGARSPVEPRHVAPVLLDVELPADGRLVEPVPATHNALLWVLEGEVTIAGEREPQSVSAGQLGVFGEGDQVTVAAGRAAARFLLAHAARIGEPVARGGPFVMNTKDEIRQAFADYESGALGGDYYIPGARKTQE